MCVQYYLACDMRGRGSVSLLGLSKTPCRPWSCPGVVGSPGVPTWGAGGSPDAPPTVGQARAQQGDPHIAEIDLDHLLSPGVGERVGERQCRACRSLL